MEKPVLYNSNMEFEHQQWKKEIAFWKKELESFNNRLSELITRWTNKEVLAQIGAYQKQFVLQESVLEDLLEIIKQQETHISEKSKASTLEQDIQLSIKHSNIRNQMETHRERCAELKKSFFRFLEKDL